MCASLAELAERDVVVSLSTLPGTAQGKLRVAAERIWSSKLSRWNLFSPIASRDYTPIMIELTFPASTTVSCVNISISGDLDLEDNEVFTVQLDSSDRAILFRPSSATVTITDDDSKV